MELHRTNPECIVEFWQLSRCGYEAYILNEWGLCPIVPEWPQDYYLIAEHVSHELPGHTRDKQLSMMFSLGQEPELWWEREDFWVHQIPRTVSPSDVIVIDSEPYLVDKFDFRELPSHT